MLAPWKESYDKPRQHIKKQRPHFASKVTYIIEAMVFPVVMNKCEIWTIKKAEHWRINAFELYSRRLLRVPWTSRRSKQSILEEINSEYSLEGLTDTEAKGPIFWPPDGNSQITGKDTDAGKDWRQEEKAVTEDEMVRWHTNSMDMSLSKPQVIARHAAFHGVTESWTQLGN